MKRSTVAAAGAAPFNHQRKPDMKLFVVVPIVVALSASAAVARAAESVAGIQLYPGSSSKNVESSEKILKDTGYPVAVCRHTGDSLAKVVAFYRNDKQLSLMGEPSKDNASFSGKAGASMSINSPWIDMSSFQTNSGTLICIASRGTK
jgi:hypothetical protein